MTLRTLGWLTVTAALALVGGVLTHPISTGKTIAPAGAAFAEVGSFPVNLVLSADGSRLAVTDSGFRQSLTLLDVPTGARVASRAFPEPEGLYYGLAFNREGGLIASTGMRDSIVEISPAQDGAFAAPREVTIPAGTRKLKWSPAGLALSADGNSLFVACNESSMETGYKGSVLALKWPEGKVVANIPTGGFPLAVVLSGGRGFVSSEQDNSITVFDASTFAVVKNLKVGGQPTGMTLDSKSNRLFVANSKSDTVSVIDLASLKVVKTISCRPKEIERLPGVTPISLSYNSVQDELFVACADLNSVAIVNPTAGNVIGWIPTGWYPTSVAATQDGKSLFIANGKGDVSRVPNGASVKGRGTYIQDIYEGVVYKVDLEQTRKNLAAVTQTALESAQVGLGLQSKYAAEFRKPPIKHVIYVIKENRTYDDVMGDISGGDGDPSLCQYPREVTPNQHALAERFGLFDNFFVCAEVSADGWNWSTAGEVNEYTTRNSIYNYSGRGRDYDFEGEVNGSPMSRLRRPDVGEPAGGYFWDLCARAKISYRNYGFFEMYAGSPEKDKHGKPVVASGEPDKPNLARHSDLDFMTYSNSYPDSEAYLKHGLPKPPRLQASFGKSKSPTRFTEWKREFDGFVKNGKLPAMTFLRFNRDHTAGTAKGLETPRGMVADNDYAVGQLVEAVSNSPYWKDTAIFVVEDDAQGGRDHVDAHRSFPLVISAYNDATAKDGTFYNTDSLLRTMELILGLPPMCQYDALARPFNIFRSTSEFKPYAAILPDKAIVGALNPTAAFGQRQSEAYVASKSEEADDDRGLSQILWRANMGKARSAKAASAIRDEDDR